MYSGVNTGFLLSEMSDCQGKNGRIIAENSAKPLSVFTARVKWQYFLTIRWLNPLCSYRLRAHLCGWLGVLCLVFIAPVWAAPSPELTLDGGSSELRDNIRHYLTIADETCSAPLWR